MAQGGKRPGAGRPKGAQNRASVEREREVKASGLTPLDFLLSVMRDVKVPRDERVDAAHKAAPYVHPKLASVEHSGRDGVPLFPPAIQFVVDADPAE